MSKRRSNVYFFEYKNRFAKEKFYNPRASGATGKPGARVTNSKMRKSSTIMRRFDLDVPRF